MKKIIINLTKVPYKETRIRQLDAVVTEWINLNLPLELGLEKELKGSLLFFEEGAKSLDEMKKISENFYIIRKDDLINASRFQKKYGIAQVINDLHVTFGGFTSITHIAIRKTCAEIVINSDDLYSLDDLRTLLHLKFNVMNEISNHLNEDEIKGIFLANNLIIKTDREGYKISDVIFNTQKNWITVLETKKPPQAVFSNV